MVRRIRELPFILLLSALLSLLATGAQAAEDRKVLQLGWDMPKPAYLRANLPVFERGIFNGIAVTMGYDIGDAVFTRVSLPDAAFRKAAVDLSEAKSPKLAHNFMFMWATHRGPFDWFSDRDWAIAEKNIRNFVRTARIGGFKGIIFDDEDYPGFRFVDGRLGVGPWGYADQIGHGARTFPQFQAQLRRRGRQFIEIVQDEFPGLTIITLHGMGGDWALLHAANDEERQRIMRNDRRWGLWPAFYNGLLDGIEPATQLIDGNEQSYYYRDAMHFDFGCKESKISALAIIAPENRNKYRQVRFASAVFVDGNLNLPGLANPYLYYGYYVSDDTKRLKLLEHNTYQALRTTDRYVWFWNQHMDWWGSKGQGQVIPAGLRETIQQARGKFNRGQPLGIVPSDFRPSPAGVGTQTNLLTNPGFETGNPAPWDWSNNGAVVSDRRSGRYGFRLGISQNLWQRVSGLKPFTIYTIRAWIKGGRGIVYGRSLGGFDERQPFSASTAFRPVTLTLLTDASYKAATFEIRNADTGAPIVVDDLELMEGRSD